MMTEDLENELRDMFARSAADIVISEQTRVRLLRHRPRRVNRRLAAGLAAAAAAAGIAVPLAAGAPGGAAGPAIRLASYTFRMPAGYHLTAARSAPCQAFGIYFPPRGAKAQAQDPANSQAMRAAASSAGGCIVLALAPPYTPTASVPDPEAPYAVHPVQVGRYRGLISHVSAEVFPEPGKPSRLGPGWHRATNLYVPLPAGGGQMRDLVVGAQGLSDSALIKIVASGLSS
jgi:hypothetical protein